MWTKVASLSAGATLAALAVVQFPAEAWEQDKTSAIRDEAPNRILAESLVARREAALRRAFDPAYRAQLLEAISALPPAELEALGSGGDDAPLPNVLGDSSADLVYTPIRPCRLFDTRIVGGPIAAGTARNFVVAAGSASLADQGGSPAGCGVPMGRATSVAINLTAVTVSAEGNLRAWAVSEPQTPQPFASSLNFGAVDGLPEIGNASIFPICDPLADDCSAGDLRVQANVSAAGVVGDVYGYFSRFTKPVDTTVLFDGPALPDAGPGATTLATVDFVPPTSGTAVLFGRGHCAMKRGTVGDNSIVLFAGLSESEAAAAPFPTMAVVSVPDNAVPAGYIQAWTVQRAVAVTAGTRTTAMLFAARPIGGSADASCTGTFSVRTRF
jgi:hypothetical protein